MQRKRRKPPCNVHLFLKSFGSIDPGALRNCLRSSQMSLSSFSSFSTSGATMLLASDCSSALGLYVPSVCLFFFTRTAATTATTPKMTVGATIAAMLTPCKWTKKKTKQNNDRFSGTRYGWMVFTGHDKTSFFTYISVISGVSVGVRCNSGRIP